LAASSGGTDGFASSCPKTDRCVAVSLRVPAPDGGQTQAPTQVAGGMGSPWPTGRLPVQVVGHRQACSGRPGAHGPQSPGPLWGFESGGAPPSPTPTRPGSRRPGRPSQVPRDAQARMPTASGTGRPPVPRLLGPGPGERPVASVGCVAWLRLPLLTARPGARRRAGLGLQATSSSTS
jgi:hypothetical protein